MDGFGSVVCFNRGYVSDADICHVKNGQGNTLKTLSEMQSIIPNFIEEGDDIFIEASSLGQNMGQTSFGTKKEQNKSPLLYNLLKDHQG